MIAQVPPGDGASRIRNAAARSKAGRAELVQSSSAAIAPTLTVR